MDIRELYSGLRRIQNRGETGNAYGGSGNKIDLLPDDWIESHEQVVWDLYVDILEKHREDLA